MRPNVVRLPDGTELTLAKILTTSEWKRRRLPSTDFDQLNDVAWEPLGLPEILSTKSPGGRTQRVRAINKTRKCVRCSGLVLPGERRCRCTTVRARRKAAKQGSLEAAHFYHLFKSIRTGDWAKTGYRAPSSAGLSEARFLAADGEGRKYQIRGGHNSRWWSATAIEFFIFRCELARHYWRDEFAALMGTRMELLAAGYPQQKVCDFLGIPRSSLLWLDREIKKFGVRLPARAVVIREEYNRLRRRMKQGVAADVIRRRQHGYKQNQSLSYQTVSEGTAKEGAIYEEGNSETATSNSGTPVV